MPLCLVQQVSSFAQPIFNLYYYIISSRFKPGGNWEAAAASPGHQAGVGNGQQREHQHEHQQCPAAAAHAQDSLVHQAQAQGVHGHTPEAQQTRAQRDREEVQPSPGTRNLHTRAVFILILHQH